MVRQMIDMIYYYKVYFLANLETRKHHCINVVYRTILDEAITKPDSVCGLRSNNIYWCHVHCTAVFKKYLTSHKRSLTCLMMMYSLSYLCTPEIVFPWIKTSWLCLPNHPRWHNDSHEGHWILTKNRVLGLFMDFTIAALRICVPSERYIRKSFLHC